MFKNKRFKMKNKNGTSLREQVAYLNTRVREMHDQIFVLEEFKLYKEFEDKEIKREAENNADIKCAIIIVVIIALALYGLIDLVGMLT